MIPVPFFAVCAFMPFSRFPSVLIQSFNALFNIFFILGIQICMMRQVLFPVHTFQIADIIVVYIMIFVVNLVTFRNRPIVEFPNRPV